MSEVKFGEILGPEDEATRAKRVKSRFWATLRRAARAIPFSEELVAAYFCALDPATPHRVRGVLLAALAYFVLPFDVVPDILAGVGFADDVTDPRRGDLGGRRPHRAAPPRGGAGGARPTRKPRVRASPGLSRASGRLFWHDIPIGSRMIAPRRIDRVRQCGATIFLSIFSAFSWPKGGLAGRLPYGI